MTQEVEQALSIVAQAAQAAALPAQQHQVVAESLKKLQGALTPTPNAVPLKPDVKSKAAPQEVKAV
jgi:hypothetical protein